MRETKYYILILYFIYIIMDLELNKTIIDNSVDRFIEGTEIKKEFDY